MRYVRPLFILTINRRFIPDADDAGYSHGVVGFVLEVARELANRGQLCGVIAYKRQAGLHRPILSRMSFVGLSCIELCFDFANDPEALREAFEKAVALLYPRPTDAALDRLVIYHQSHTLLPMTPADLPFAVTHDGPFAAEISRLFGIEIATDAFQGGRGKLRHLIRAQTAGLDCLKHNSRGVALEMSTVQERVLKLHGIPQARIKSMPPPLTMWEDRDPGCQIPSEVPYLIDAESVDGAAQLHLVTATARADSFKNLSQLIRIFVRLGEADLTVTLTMFTGGIDEEDARNKLRMSIPDHLRVRTSINPRLSHKDLLSFLFHYPPSSTIRLHFAL